VERATTAPECFNPCAWHRPILSVSVSAVHLIWTAVAEIGGAITVFSGEHHVYVVGRMRMVTVVRCRYERVL